MHEPPGAGMNIVFDLGGVLFRWQPHEFVARLLPHHAPTAEAALALTTQIFRSHDGGDWGDFDRGTVEPLALAERLARRTGISAAEATSIIDAVPGELVAIAGTVALLQRLHDRGHALYYLSNMPAPYATELLATHGFFGLFRRGVFSAHIRMIKPEPEIFTHAIQAFGIEPAETLFIDDLLPNAEAARAAGWRAIWFRDAEQCGAELDALGLL